MQMSHVTVMVEFDRYHGAASKRIPNASMVKAVSKAGTDAAILDR